MSCAELAMFKRGFCSFPSVFWSPEPFCTIRNCVFTLIPCSTTWTFQVPLSPRGEILWHGNSNAVLNSNIDAKLISKQKLEDFLSCCLSKWFCSFVLGGQFHLGSSLIKTDADAALVMFKMVADHDSFNLRPRFKWQQEMKELMGKKQHVLRGQSISLGGQTAFKKKKRGDNQEKTAKGRIKKLWHLSST